MTDLLEIREKIKMLYSRYETFILPVVKFLLAFVALTVLNRSLGYMSQLDNIAIVLIAALMCSFLPTGFIVLFGVLFSLLHMYVLSIEVALVGVCVYLVMFLLFFRFSPKDSLVVVFTPLLFAMRIPYIVPIAVGLVCSPVSAVSVGCGIVAHYLLGTVADSASAINTLGEEDAIAKLRLVIDGLIRNREMVVMIAAFVITVTAVYLIRRMSVDYSWTIAMVAGALINVMILLIGDLIYDINISVAGALLGSLLALVVAKVIEFFRFCVDYSRTEKVQFEDDEYYYYVKAVPKMTVAMSTKTVKKINTQHSKGDTQYSKSSAGRRVISARTGSNRDRYASTGIFGKPGYKGGRSVTVGNTPQDELEEISEDFDEFL